MTYRKHKQDDVEKLERQIIDQTSKQGSDLTKEARAHEIQRLNALSEIQSIKAGCEIRLEIKEKKE